MKKIIHLLSFVFASLFSQGFAQTGHEIKFNIKGLKEGGKVQFAYYQGDKKLLQDTVFVTNNQFVVKGKEALQRGLYLVALPDLGYFDIVISDDQFFEIETDPNNMIAAMKIKGNDENTFFYEYLRKVKPLQDGMISKSEAYTKDSCSKVENNENKVCKVLFSEITDLQNKLKIVKDEYVKAHPSFLTSTMFQATEEVEVPLYSEIKDEKIRQEKRFNYYKQHYFDNINLKENGLIRTPILEDKIDKYFKDLTFQICDSVKKSADLVVAKANDKTMFKYLLTHITTKYEKSNIMCMDCMTLHMFDKYYIKDSLKVDWVNKETRKKLQEEVWKLEFNQCGKQVYPLVMKDTNGVKHDILKLDAEYTILFFWSATCGHCKKSAPKLLEMYHRLKEEYNLEVYSVHIDKSRTEFDKYVKENKFDWILTIDDGTNETYRTAYNVFSTPTVYLLNSKKEIIAKKVDLSVLEKIITGKDVVPSQEEDHDH